MGGEIPRAHESGQLHGIPTVSFDAVASSFRNQRGSDDPAEQVLLREIAIEPVSAWSLFIDKGQACGVGLKLSDELINVGLPGADGAAEVSLPIGSHDV
jgi:hypothetical protein